MLSIQKHFLKTSNCFLKRECSSIIKEDIIKPRNIAKRVLNIALVGRPNTGKSTLFNRLTGKKLAIVSPVPGTTRDRKEGKGSIAGLSINVIDTGGLDDRGAVSINIQNQVEHALREADVILFMIDAKVGVSTIDEFFAKWLRKKLGSISNKNLLETIPYNNNNRNNNYRNNNNRNNNINLVTNGFEDENDEDKDNRNILQQEDIAELNLNNSKKRDVFVVANKSEGSHLSNLVLDTISDALRLGLGDPIPISASHGDGMADLAQHLIAAAKSRGLDDGNDDTIKERNKTPITLEERVIQLAIMGKPNVGKSTLVNSFIGQDRLIAGPQAGLTRDSIQIEWTYRDRLFSLVDTAGLTRLRLNKRILNGLAVEKKVTNIRENTGLAYKNIDLPGIEVMNHNEDPSQFSYQVSELALVSALNSLRFAQVVLLVVEGSTGKFSKLDLQLARKCLEEGRGLVIAANKKDLVAANGVSNKQYEDGVRKHCESFMREFGDVPVIAVSGLENSGVNRILNSVLSVHDAYSKRIDTWVLNKWLKDLMVSQSAPRIGGKNITIKYMTQVKSRPPTFALFTNIPELPGSYERFIRSRLQHDLSLQGVPIRFVIRKTTGRDVDKTRLSQGMKTRRGVGHGESRPVGPKREDEADLRRRRKVQDTRRRRDTKQARARTGYK